MVNFSGASSSDMASTSAVPSASYSLIRHFVEMGYPEYMVAKAIEENGEHDEERILDALLTYKAHNDSPSQTEPVYALSSSESENDPWDDMSDLESCLGDEEDGDLPDKEKKLLHLVDMDFHVDEASSAIDVCGPDTSITDLIDYICAARMSKRSDFPLRELPHPLSDYNEMSPGYRGCPSTFKKRKQLFNAEERVERKAGIGRRQQKESGKNHKRVWVEDDQVHIPKHMIGFGVPNEPRLMVQRKLPEAAIGPPYFYFENVACAPKGVWSTISRFLYEVEPEFVDSLHFCPAASKRGYVHNLPICDRFPLKPIPPLTIQAALPLTKKWWPSWDRRDKFTCLRTCIGSAKLTERIKEALECCNGDPPLETQKYVLYQCRKWNLVWTGKNKAAPLEPDEKEMLMGYPQNHTRGASRTERYKTLGNSFQVDTVAYHFSVLKRMFPNGITVLSLFTGIGGAEIALHRLGIPLKAVVSVEVSEVSRSIFRSWWEQTNQTGDLIELEDVQLLSVDKLQIYISSFGGFDLVVGGSPCNNLTGSNIHHRDGLNGEHSVLFFEFYRILDTVKCMMASNL